MVSEPAEKKPNYRQEAENIRAKARGTHDAEARAQLLLIASLYDKLADHFRTAVQPKSYEHPRPDDSTE
jgi:hypothetical protein